MISISEFANFNSSVPWGLWVAIYAWLIGISAGGFALVMWGRLTNNPNFNKLTKLSVVLSLSALVIGLLSILIDLEHIERSYHLAISPNPTSIMGWMPFVYGIFFVTLGLFPLYQKKKVPNTVLFTALIISLAVMIIESLLFALPPGKQWHSFIFPIHFLTSSLAAGIAALIVAVNSLWANNEEKRKLVEILGGSALFVFIANFIVEAADLISHGKLGHMGDVLLLLGSIAAVILLLKRTSVSIAIAGFVMLLQTLLAKYSGIVSAQAAEPYKGFADAYVEPRLMFNYAPNTFEVLVTISLICMAAALFYFLYKIFPVTREA